MLARPLLLLWLLLTPLSALASLDARGPVVTLWSLPAGFTLGLASLLVRPSRRWLFLLVPVALGTLTVISDGLPVASPMPLWEVLLAVSVVGGFLLLLTGAGFLLALIAKLSVVALLGLSASAASSRSSQPPGPPNL
jgi:hypothetical protein